MHKQRKLQLTEKNKNHQENGKIKPRKEEEKCNNKKYL